MNHRRVISSLLALALLAGSVFVPLARAACAVSQREAPACPSCASEPAGSGLSLSIDRSCCAPPSLSEREPAALNSDPTGADHRALIVTPAVADPAPGLGDRFDTGTIVPSASPALSPPLLRTTILLI